ncbi:MAG: CDP-diacylglycerol--serine O-phosphatidyltransferase [Bacteriovoracaceae bacterium]|nr:CDP-diacylglycerol--serine O-phosphatidyltransferase [Bacteriovoracaceae bacterium]
MNDKSNVTYFKRKNTGDARRLTFFLPNIFTALNMGCGFSAIIFSWQGKFHIACMILLLGAIFDSVDGRVARLTGTESSFGEQFDSLSDVISFGIAPALIFYNRFLTDLGRLGLVVAFIYLLCGALRLARFNANIDRVDSAYFQGLPIPGAALAIIGYILLSLEFPIFVELSILSAVYLVFYSFLMVSNISFWSMKNVSWLKTHKKRVLLLIFLLLALMFVYEQLMIIIIIKLYVVGSLTYYFIKIGNLHDAFWGKSESE